MRAMSASSALSLNAVIAWPTPNQPGSMTRACAQLNTQGIARRSSSLVLLVLLDGREPILRPEISAIGVLCRMTSRHPTVSDPRSRYLTNQFDDSASRALEKHS